MTCETLSFLPLLDAMEHPEWLLKGMDGFETDLQKVRNPPKDLKEFTTEN